MSEANDIGYYRHDDDDSMSCNNVAKPTSNISLQLLPLKPSPPDACKQ